WITVPGSPWFVRAGLAGVLAGASTNLIDRSIDGVVTDYLHTGWFPTFNLPDVFITVGAALVVLGVLRPPQSTFPPVRTAPEDR
ncbi:MAG TPA: signal peptidase II, partial [Micropruina sp.]|nr:signal peptidase II [Micropruina sp.]